MNITGFDWPSFFVGVGAAIAIMAALLLWYGFRSAKKGSGT